MPVTFAPGPHPSSARRASASSPYPGRLMTSLVPQDLPTPPRKKRASSSSSSPTTPERAPPPPSPRALDDPFTDDRNTMSIPPRRESVACYERACRAACSPQAEFSVPYTDETEQAARSPRASSRDPERQPLLGEDDESPRAVQWQVNALIALAILIITAVILGVFRLVEG